MANAFEIRKDLEVPVAADVLWQAIATTDGQAGWSPDPYTSLDGHSVERDAPNRFAVESPVDEQGAFHRFEYLITPTDDGAALTFVHSGDLGDEWSADFDYAELTSYGWDLYMHNLQQYLVHFADRPPVFVTGQAPQHATTHGAWQQLEQVLGLTVSARDLSVGDRIQLSPRGLPVIKGTVDYVVPGEDFLGVWSEHGLYRFHSLEPMGMPIAFGHYLYQEPGHDIDRVATEYAWQEWLNTVFQ